MQFRFSPVVSNEGVTFRLWAPSLPDLAVVVRGFAPVPARKTGDGFWAVTVPGIGAGARYKFQSGTMLFPDPASRRQDGDTTGWSVVTVLPLHPDRDRSVRRWHEAIIAEIHVGTATPEGTFAALADRLTHFRDAGYTAIELMPLNDFPGSRNWGYDGTLIFAPDEAYGSPDDLCALVDRGHELGLAMIVDAVYNHFGETGNFVADYAPEWFDPEIATPWGPGIDFTREQVRSFYYENVCHWLAGYDFDGVRFDAVHEIGTEQRDLFLGELAKAARADKPDAILVIENVGNNAHWLTRGEEDDEPVDFTAQWNDDFHHVLNFLVTGEIKRGYGGDSDRDAIADLEKSLADGFVHDGDAGPGSDGRTRDEPGSSLPPQAFVDFSQNHDQIGNRADGKRLVDRIDPQQLDFCRFLVLLNPQIPLFFMGEEANLRCGFPFFFDLPEEVAARKRADRYTQMAEIFNETVGPEGLPDPQARQTFERAKLDWQSYSEPRHQAALARFRELVDLRRNIVWPLSATRCRSALSVRQGDGIIVTWKFDAGLYSMALNPTGAELHLSCGITAPEATTGDWSVASGVLTLGRWSAVVWQG